MIKDIYQIERRLENQLKRLKDDSKPNSGLILNFYERYCIKNKLSTQRTVKLLQTLYMIGIVLENKPLNKFQEKDLENLNIYLAKKGLKTNTINDYRVIIKTWLKFCGDKKNLELSKSKELKEIKKNGEDQLDPDSLPTDQEVLQLLNVLSVKYKALLAILDGGGLRCGEAATLLRKNIKFDDTGALTVNYIGKTGRNSVKIHAGMAHYVLEWFNQAPFKEDEDPLFPSRDKNIFLAHNSIVKELKNAAEKIGILGKRKVNPHIFRHRHATWALTHLPPALAKKRIWNNAATDMDKIYGHFTKEMVDEAYDEALGLKPKSKEGIDLLKARICFKCQKSLSPSIEVCPDCSVPVSPLLLAKQLEEKNGLEKRLEQMEENLAKLTKYVINSQIQKG